MSVVDLKLRITNIWEDFCSHEKESSSKIFVDSDIIYDNDSPGSLNLTVGNNYILKGKLIEIPKEGLKVSAGKSVVIETKQRIAMPYNILGIVVGVGINIFSQGIVSPGKIDPGFNGKLKITYFNAGDSAIIFKPNDLLACCSFWNTDFTIEHTLQNYNAEVQAATIYNNSSYKTRNWFKKNWPWLITTAISIMAVIMPLIFRS